jgi:formylglycine-generating enzyme required for sulfatase activity
LSVWEAAMFNSPEHPCCAPGRGQPYVTQSVGSQSARPQPKRRTRGMAALPGGEFVMGTDEGTGHPEDGEGPARRVVLRPFWLDVCAVTNAQFLRFVKASGYVTEAERYRWSFVFHSFVSPRIAQSVTKTPLDTPWWSIVERADWRRPEGPDSSIHRRMEHPVVHVSWNDAAAYSEWATKRLPSEAEWEFAARGGLLQETYPWGNELTPQGEHRCNIWQGVFPDHNSREDGHTGTCPVRTYPPNDFGLYNMVGNVWEWCSDWFSPSYPTEMVCDNPQGPQSGRHRSMRGGSYLCHQSYCNRYRVAARGSNTPDSSTGNLGFRCARDA